MVFISVIEIEIGFQQKLNIMNWIEKTKKLFMPGKMYSCGPILQWKKFTPWEQEHYVEEIFNVNNDILSTLNPNPKKSLDMISNNVEINLLKFGKVLKQDGNIE